MAIALASAILTAHKSIFDHLDDVFDHVGAQNRWSF
jgi:hypothetical protein